MFYTHARNGIKKIYLAQILSLISVFMTGVAAAYADQASGSGMNTEKAIGIMLPILAVGLLKLAGSLVEFFGLKEAAQDDENFKQGYTYALINIVCSIILAVLSVLNLKNETISDLGNSIRSIIQMIVTLYVVYGIRSIARELGNHEMDERGKKVFFIYGVSIILSSAIQLVAAFLKGSAKIPVLAILGAAVLALAVVGYFMYLSYLGKAKKMLG